MHNYKVGDKVRFGRSHGEQTLGEVVKVNPTKLKIKQLEQRGTSKAHPIGTIWTVPPSLVRLADGVSALADGPITDPADDSISSIIDDEDHAILEAIGVIYNHLSPENLSCDGEAPLNFIRTRQAKLNSKLRHLFAAFGRPVSEAAYYKWKEGPAGVHADAIH